MIDPVQLLPANNEQRQICELLTLIAAQAQRIRVLTKLCEISDQELANLETLVGLEDIDKENAD